MILTHDAKTQIFIKRIAKSMRWNFLELLTENQKGITNVIFREEAGIQNYCKS
jgi:hypothetical protein